MWSDEQQAFAQAWTAALLAFARQAFVRGTFSDAVAWQDPNETDRYTQLNFALVGDGLKVARTFGYFSAEGGENLDLGTRAGPIAYAAKTILRATEMARDLAHDTVTIPDFLSRLEGQAIYEFADSKLPFDGASARIIIEPGYPWPSHPLATGETFSYWSSKKGRMIKAERPAWLMSVESREQPGKFVLGVNPCRVFPAREPKRIWPVWGRSGNTDLFVTHTMALLRSPELSYGTALGAQPHKATEGAVQGVRDCGGFLFPSLAVGPIPASNFGPITLVGHLGLVLEGLKPYRQRGDERPSWVYAHDAWTTTTGEMMGPIAIRLFDELHGHEDFTYGYHIWTIGMPSEWFGGPTQGSSPLDTTKQLLAAVKRRSASFKRNITEQQFEQINEGVAGTADKYAYCEAKARSVIGVNEFPLMIGPDSLGEQMRRFARGVGFRGRVVELPDTIGAGEDNASDYTMFRWSWIVADAIKSIAKEPMEI